MKQQSNRAIDPVALRCQVKALRQSIKGMEAPQTPTVPSQRHAIVQRVQHLKMFCRGKSPEQLDDIAQLKEQRVRDTINIQFPGIGQKKFHHHDLYELLLDLDNSIGLGEWHLRESSEEVIVYASYGSVFPGLRFQKQGERYRCRGFNFDIRLVS
ncbi:hypothetical protein [Vibrio tapetis]|uniref:Uncharacterized protein n=1 Tax=Vibrio tapetis subsp. tapetis TaxID=1671868 RepID=A0A2N8ZIB7_9VIBR|nr:hypothetical protein [Vibrio tapetis]SON51637.1 conserved protein of unknown function [Vibrio tapetis subsp. tapetis]